VALPQTTARVVSGLSAVKRLLIRLSSQPVVMVLDSKASVSSLRT
jgi:hypothetical protein